MEKPDITGVILAGGRSLRMGQDKGLVKVNSQPLFEHIAARLAPQVGQILISANQNQHIYGENYQIIGDVTSDYAGPLAGMLAALQASSTEWTVFVPCDVPDFPDNLLDRLWNEKGSSAAAYAEDGDRAHPTLCLLHKRLITPLSDYLNAGERKLMLFFEQQRAQKVRFKDSAAFANLNTPQDVSHWQQLTRGSR